MNELTDRAKVFRAAIASFVGKKLEKKPKDENDNFAAATEFECEDWLSKAIKNVPRLYTATHILKATHTKATGNNLHVSASNMVVREEIGTHSLGNIDEDIIASSAAYLGASSFLRAEAEGRRFLDWIRRGDTDFRAALHPDISKSEEWMATLQRITYKDEPPATHPMAKQVYWLIGEEPQDDTQYHLLQPMFSSPLTHAVHADIQNVRFGEVNKAARQVFHERKPSNDIYCDYRNLAVRKLGGTKPQNISQLNSERTGINYLLPSLPPTWKPRGPHLLKRKSVFEEFIWFGDVRDQVKALADYLESVQDKTTNMKIRNERDALVNELVESLTAFSLAIRAYYSAGWTRDEHCRLPRCEQLWLDSERAELPLRDDPNRPEWREDDATFREDYDHGEWADEVAGRFGLWLNDQLRKRSDALMALGEAAMRHFARKVILDVAWPIPLQRHAKVDAT